ncbi:hypothetical protein NY2A_b490L [Paramecium bursaria Chlorella virus NY2A]|uniref:Uncharacterized protein b490L n=1 Tax=Paramecium bursaria Chlorella virus NY2A TaxID=46021 RepID=A7IX15_PBCVN|nr:hypothetical protein NY2A_b490L [Paramecium bursaria Chlorella virus NY2A]ABT14889.1 hypothetical protein NY2A_b490L [Paramecium bursaria Chlorella virus NY2A]
MARFLRRHSTEDNLVVTRVSGRTRKITKELPKRMSVHYRRDISIKLADVLALETVRRIRSSIRMANVTELEVMSPKICVV